MTRLITTCLLHILGIRISKGQEEIDVTAPIVISAAGVINTFKNLLPKEVAEKTGTANLILKCIFAFFGPLEYTSIIICWVLGVTLHLSVLQQKSRKKQYIPCYTTQACIHCL